MKTNMHFKCIFLAALMCALNANVATGQAVGAITSVSMPSSIMAGGSFDISVTFDNTGSSIGYGPFVDIMVPPGSMMTVNPTASYLTGKTLAPEQSVTFSDVTTWVNHDIMMENSVTPTNDKVVDGASGDTLHAFRLPFVSFAPGQPSITLKFSVTTSASSTEELTDQVYARAGFLYGSDQSAASAATFSAGRDYTTWTSATITVGVQYTSSITFASAPAVSTTSPKVCTLTVELIPGQKYTNMTTVVWIPDGVNITQFLETSGASIFRVLTVEEYNSWCAISKASLCPTYGGAGHGGKILQCVWEEEYTAVTSTRTVEVEYTNAVDLINPTTGQAVELSWPMATAADTYRTSCSCYQPSAPAEVTQSITYYSLYVTRSVSLKTNTGYAGYTPGDTVAHSVSFHIDKEFSFTSVQLVETLTDGNALVGAASSIVSTPAYDTVNSVTGASGETIITFTWAGKLDGYQQISLSYDSTIEDKLDNNSPLLHKSTVSHTSVVSGTVDNGGLQGSIVTNSASSSVTTQVGDVECGLYAINNTPCGSFAACAALNNVAIGNTVTYRLTSNLAHTDFQSLVYTIYAPHPVHTLSTINAAMEAAGSTPAANKIAFGSSDTLTSTFAGANPTVAVNSGDNSITLTYPTNIDDSSNRNLVVDALVTLTVLDSQIPDSFPLTLQVIKSEATNGIVSAETDIVIRVPAMSIVKGVVKKTTGSFTNGGMQGITWSAPGSTGARNTQTVTSITNLVSGLQNVDGADKITMCIGLQNTGGASAHDVRVRDIETSVFAAPAGGKNLRVADGTGATITYTGNLWDANGITLTTAVPAGGIVLITYDLDVAATVIAGTTYTEEARLEAFTAITSGVNQLPNSVAASSTVKVNEPSIQLVDYTTSFDWTATSLHSGSRPDLAIGESMTHRVKVKFPECHTTVTDFRFYTPSWSRFYDIQSVTVSRTGANIAIVGDPIAFGSSDSNKNMIASSVTVTNNPDGTANAEDELEFTIVGILANTNSVTNGNKVRAQNRVTFKRGTGATVHKTTNREADVVEPSHDINHVFSKSSVQAGDNLTIVVSTAVSGVSTDAKDVTLTTTISSDAAIQIATANMGTLTQDGQTVTVTLPTLTSIQSLSITIATTVNSGFVVGTPITSTAGLTYYSEAEGKEKQYTANRVGTIVSADPVVDYYPVDGSDVTLNNHPTFAGEVINLMAKVTIPNGVYVNAYIQLNVASNYVMKCNDNIQLVAVSSSIQTNFLGGFAAAIAAGWVDVDGNVRFNLDQVSNGVTATVDTIDIKYTCYADGNRPAWASGLNLLAGTSVTFGADNTSVNKVPVQTLVAKDPVLTLGISPDPALVSVGQADGIVTWTLDHAAASGVDAHQLVATFDAHASLGLTPASDVITGDNSLNGVATTASTSTYTIGTADLAYDVNVQAPFVVNSGLPHQDMEIRITATWWSTTTSVPGAKQYTTQQSSVVRINGPPVAVADTFQITKDVPNNVPVTDNDSDADGNMLGGSVNIITNPTNGAVVVTGINCVYTPTTGYEGLDSFTYQVCDTLSACSATVTVSMTVVDIFPTVTYLGRTYAVLDRSDPTSTGNGCQPDTYLTLPFGFTVAQNTPVNRGVLTCHNFGTSCLVFADGASYSQSLTRCFETSQLLENNGLFKPATCDTPQRVLIVKENAIDTTVTNAGFEGAVTNGVIPNWTAFGIGYDVDTVAVDGTQSIKLVNDGAQETGAYQDVTLTNDHASGFTVGVYTKSDGIAASTAPSSAYSLYIDIFYDTNPATFDYGITVNFAPSAAWQFGSVAITPKSGVAVKFVRIHTVLRNTVGTAWFDKIVVIAGTGNEIKNPLFTNDGTNAGTENWSVYSVDGGTRTDATALESVATPLGFQANNYVCHTATAGSTVEKYAEQIVVFTEGQRFTQGSLHFGGKAVVVSTTAPTGETVSSDGFSFYMDIHFEDGTFAYGIFLPFNGRGDQVGTIQELQNAYGFSKKVKQVVVTAVLRAQQYDTTVCFTDFFVVNRAQAQCNAVLPPPGAVYGDPHLKTFDGYAYDLQLVGEFTTVLDKAADTEIQSRFEAAGDSASVVSAFGGRVGPTKFFMGRSDGTFSPEVWVNGAIIDFSTAAGSAVKAGHGTVQRTKTFTKDLMESYQFDFQSVKFNIEVLVSQYAVQYMEIAYQSSTIATTEGLLGSGDNNQEDDFLDRKGQPLKDKTGKKIEKLADMTPEIIHDVFGEEWRVNKLINYMQYDVATGESTAVFVNKAFPKQTRAQVIAAEKDTNSEIYKAAEQACGKQYAKGSRFYDDCVFDVISMNDDTVPQQQASSVVKTEGTPQATLEQSVSSISTNDNANAIVGIAGGDGDEDGFSANQDAIIGVFAALVGLVIVVVGWTKWSRRNKSSGGPFSSGGASPRQGEPASLNPTRRGSDTQV
eukprot:GFYU01002687.1.p1 GENE.GFYU01002687.1~~GFYU01002687.1.p1  ORF type:complete len:2405 (+),score=916.36 GFYU01002687.1:231-7445(+)